MERLGLYVLCVLLLTTCAQGKTVQQLGDDPPCGTPVECYAQAIEALKEAEQKIEGLNNAILTLNQTLKQVVTNQSQVNEQLKANQTQMSEGIQQLKANQSALKPYPCNCTDDTYQQCPPPKMSQGYVTFCNSQCPGYYAAVFKYNSTTTGHYCCNLCMGTAEEAKAYALAHPLPEPVLKDCGTLKDLL